MDELILGVVEIVRLGACADVTIAIPVSFENAVYGCEEEVVPDVEFATVVEEWAVYV